MLYNPDEFTDWIDVVIPEGTPPELVFNPDNNVCPVPPDTIVVVEMNNDPDDIIAPMSAKQIQWHCGDQPTRYRANKGSLN